MSSQPDIERIRAAIENVEAPAGLRSRIAAEHAARSSPRVVLRHRMRVTGALAAAAAVAGVVVALVVPADAPSVLQAAALAANGPTAPAPPRDPAHPGALRLAVDGVAFPTWKDRYPWRPAGQRSDTIDGRHTATVFYEGDGRRLAYTIVAGHALGWPSGSRRVVRNGVEVHVYTRSGRVVATWREHGHQCVISAPQSVGERAMVALASADASAEAQAYTRREV
jgi:hypothetical protein